MIFHMPDDDIDEEIFELTRQIALRAQCNILIHVISTYIKLKLHWNWLQNKESIKEQIVL